MSTPYTHITHIVETGNGGYHIEIATITSCEGNETDGYTVQLESGGTLTGIALYQLHKTRSAAQQAAVGQSELLRMSVSSINTERKANPIKPEPKP